MDTNKKTPANAFLEESPNDMVLTAPNDTSVIGRRKVRQQQRISPTPAQMNIRPSKGMTTKAGIASS